MKADRGIVLVLVLALGVAACSQPVATTTPTVSVQPSPTQLPVTGETVEKAAHQWLTWPVVFAGFLGLLLYLIAPSLVTPLGYMDDHEIPVIERQLADSGYVATVVERASELDAGRFRPAYWIARVAEVAAWGDQAVAWHLVRLALLLLSVGLLVSLARRWFPVAASVLAAAVLVVGPQAEAFTLLGPQEAYAVPLTLAGLVLVSRDHYRSGLALAVLAAFVKEPFVASALVTALWAWRRGARPEARIATAVALVAGAGVTASLAMHEGIYYREAIPMAGRYLYPAWIVVALIAGLLVTRWRFLTVPVIAGLVALAVVHHSWADDWRSHQVAFAAFTELLRAETRPLVLVVNRSADGERAWALRGYLDGPMELRAPFTLPGFGRVIGDCLEVDLDSGPMGYCAEAMTGPG